MHAAAEADPEVPGLRRSHGALRGCALASLGGTAIVGVLFVAGFVALSSLTFEGCSFALCTDPCLDDPTRLAEAATAGDLDEVHRAVEEDGADDVEELTEAGTCALRYDHREVAVALIGYGADATELVPSAVRAGQLEVVDAALRSGSDPQDVLEEVAGPVGLGGELQLLCRRSERVALSATDDDQRAMVAAALDAGADPNGPSDEEQLRSGGSISPLLRSSYLGRKAVAEELLGAGADPNHGGRVDRLFVEMAQRALLSFQDVDALPPVESSGPDVTGVTPLIGAATGGHPDVLEMLLAWGADPNIAADGRFVALHAAAARGDRAMVDLLLGAGARAAPPLEPGTITPAETARRLGHTDLAEHLALLAYVELLDDTS